MAGVYIHIPFCKSRCKYCDFYSTTMLDRRDEYVKALLGELELRKHYLPDKNIRTIYFGGGTPSLLSAVQISLILQKIQELFEVDIEAEITLETNPGDLTKDYLQTIREVGINRLSIGIQSFDDHKLRLIGRRHTAQEAKAAVLMAQEAGFGNISIDLIYGLPGQTIDEWKAELMQALELNIQHISTYCLSYEQGTALTNMLESGEIQAVDDDTENLMYAILVNTLKESGFCHYEVSNFARAGYYSHHNSAYWNNTPYMGIGAAAHSYDGCSRQWNTSDLNTYIRQVESHNLQPETEHLTDKDKYNELVMLSLRTDNGIDLSRLTEDDKAYCLGQAEQFIERQQLELTGNRLTATMSGINILNLITEHLMQ